MKLRLLLLSLIISLIAVMSQRAEMLSAMKNATMTHTPSSLPPKPLNGTALSGSQPKPSASSITKPSGSQPKPMNSTLPSDSQPKPSGAKVPSGSQPKPSGAKVPPKNRTISDHLRFLEEDY
jgi:hypothetical protein